MKFRFIEAEKERHDVRMMCSVLHVSRSGFYAWQGRGPSHRDREDERLKKRIREVHEKSRGSYGSPRVQRILKADEEGLGLRRVARLMREEGLQGKPRKHFVKTTDSAHDYVVPPNVLGRRFAVERPNTVWAGDITYLPTAQGWSYLAVVLDLFSRRVVGWSTAKHMRTELVIEAMQHAVEERQPTPGLLFHSDRGTQYASHAFQTWLHTHGMRSSMSRRGNCWDNAPVESFFRSLKVEGLSKRPAPNHEAATLAVFDYVEGFYNRHRLHSYLNFRSPIEFEEWYAA